MTRAGGAALAALLLLARPAAAAGPEQIGKYGNWSAWTMAGECFAHASPQKSEGDYTRRGDVSVSVTNRPARGIADEVSFAAGYSFRPKSVPTVEIEGVSFRLFVAGDTAFAPDAKTDQALVAAMKKGSAMVIRGVSGRGTETTDRYSLRGFTLAWRAVGRACPPKK